MMDLADHVTKPAGDSRPIRYEELLKHEQDLIRSANGLLRGIQSQNKEDAEEDAKRTRSSSPKDPWAIVDHNRRHRVIMISGPRGSGKTSLMLTLLAGWLAAWNKDWNAIADPQNRKNAEDLFEDMASVVRPLQPLDFDPLPPDLPLYGWIVQAFHPLVMRLLNDRQPGARVRSYREMGDSEKERVSPWSDNPKSLREQWQDLYRTAIVGWGTGKLREAFQNDLYDLVIDQEQQHFDWQQLRNNWKKFLDSLFEDLDRRSPDVFPENGLLVLPIDDGDLQIGRDRELILAIRLLHHPRLVYLLTGDIDNLEYVLYLDVLRSMLQSGLSRDEELVDTSKESARILSNALIKKVLPSSHVLGMTKLTFSQILEWDEKASMNLLDKILIKQDVTLRQFFEQRSKAPDFDFDCLLFRDLQHFQDQYMKMTRPSTEPLGGFLEMLRNELDPEEFTVGKREKQQIVLHTFPGLIVPVARVYHSEILSSHIEVCVGVNLEFNQEPLTHYMEDPSKLERPKQASPLTLLALDLAAEAPHIYVRQHTPRIQPPQCLAWSIWRSESYETWFPWPSIGASSPTELARRAEDWGKAVRQLDTYKGDEWVDRIALAWIYLHLQWLEKSEDGLPAVPELDTDMDKAWSRLKSTLRSVDSKTRSSPWFETGLPLLAAPEYGLSEQAQAQLFDALQALGRSNRRRSSSPAIPQEWQSSRLNALRDAQRFKRGQIPKDWYEVHTRDQDRDVTVEERVQVLLAEITAAFPKSPWAHRGTATTTP